MHGLRILIPSRAIYKAVNKGFAEAILIGKSNEIIKACNTEGIDEKLFTIIDVDDDNKASLEAVRLAKTGEADIVMKGLVGTDKFLKEVMDKEKRTDASRCCVELCLCLGNSSLS